MGYFFASLISTVFSTFLFFHFSISVSRINDAVGLCIEKYYSICFITLRV